MSATVSVIIPTFNRAGFVQEAIDSVLAQQCAARFEIIVIDDGSGDDTRTALARYGERIRYVRQQNAGLNAARNHALRLASGDYIALLDDDDVWLPFKTALELQALSCFPQAAFVHSNFFIWKSPANRRPDGIRTWFPRQYAWEELYRDSADLALDGLEQQEMSGPSLRVYYGDTYYWALHAPMVLPSAAIIRRAALDDNLRFPEFDPTCGDWDFFARLSHHHGGVFVPCETTLNRSHDDPGRLTRVNAAIQLRRRIALIRRLWRCDPQFMTAHAPEVDAVEAACLRKLAKRQLGQGDSDGARVALSELKELGPTVQRPDDLALAVLTWMPNGMINVLRGFRSALRRSS